MRAVTVPHGDTPQGDACVTRTGLLAMPSGNKCAPRADHERFARKQRGRSISGTDPFRPPPLPSSAPL
eukprot:1174002-Prorocentrum_minimum.AAC.1